MVTRPLAIEINDAGLRASTAAGPAGSPSPGYAHLDGRAIVTGEAARRVARLEPRHVSHRHWDLMSLASVGRPFPAALRQADLVHAHLASYRSDLEAALGSPLAGAPVLLVVPASYSSAQLALLVGVARAVEVPVAGVVDAPLAAVDWALAANGGALAASDGALAASGGAGREERTLHVDVLLHRAVLTLIEPGSAALARGTRRRTGTAQVEGAGLLAVHRHCAERLARRFVRETRFDPLHRAESEQTLYDRLPEWTREVAEHGGAVATLDARHSIEITAGDLLAAAAEPNQAIARAAASLAGGVSVDLAISGRAARLPGLAARLAEVCGREPIRLADDAATAGALRHRDAIESPGGVMRLIIELPLEASAGSVPSPSSPSHV